MCVVMVLHALSPACGTAPARCCLADDDCAAGARCFEGACSPRCRADSDCLDGQQCVEGGVCAAPLRAAGECSFVWGDKISDAGARSAGDAGWHPDAGGSCEDPFEPNDTVRLATPGPLSASDLGICLGDQDYFVLPAAPGDRLTAEIRFSHAAGDLDMELLRRGEQVRVSQGVSDTETIEWVAPFADDYLLRVYGFGEEVQNRYQLSFIRVAVGSACVDDAYEENDDAASARELPLGQAVFAALCGTDPIDHYYYDVAPASRTIIELDAPDRFSPLVLTVLPGPFEVELEASTERGARYSVVTTQGGPLRFSISGDLASEEYQTYGLHATSQQRPCDDEFEPNDVPELAHELMWPRRVDALLCDSDVDFYRLSLPSGLGAYQLVLEGSDALRGSLLHEGTLDVVADMPPGHVVSIPLSPVDDVGWLVRITKDTPGVAPYALELR